MNISRSNEPGLEFQMKSRDRTSGYPVLACSMFLLLLVAGCARSVRPCPAEPYADLSGAGAFAVDDRLPFRFPLDDVSSDASPSYTNFCTGSSGPESARKYHAAEDYFRPAGTPVYAIADGVISFSGRMGGYGWLIIIDHPQANLYSLYGHLSPSRWRMEPGVVEKGALIAYLGDGHENGGSARRPLEPHLHLGIRAGRRADYPGRGEWRWQAGWIKPCPKALGWLQPSAIITGQDIPVDGWQESASGFVAKWGIELVFAGIYLFGGMCTLVYATKKDKPFALIVFGIILLAAGWIFYTDGWKMSYVLLSMGVLFPAIGVVRLIRRSKHIGRDND